MSRALEARQIPTEGGGLTADVEAMVKRVDGLLLITEIRVRHRVVVPKGKEAAAERALAVHDRECDVSQSVQRGIRVVVDGEVVADGT